MSVGAIPRLSRDCLSPRRPLPIDEQEKILGGGSSNAASAGRFLLCLGCISFASSALLEEVRRVTRPLLVVSFASPPFL